MVPLGPFVGHTTQTSTRLWVRCATGVSNLVEILPGGVNLAADLTDLERGVYILDVEGLAPGTAHTIIVRDDDGAPIGAPVRVTTASAAPSTMRLWFGSCYSRFSGTAIWNTMLKRMPIAPPDALFLLGDQAYADEGREWPGQGLPYFTQTGAALEASYESLYERSWTDSVVANVLASVPTYMTWDDHDLVDDWGSDPSKRLTLAPARAQYNAISRVYRRYQRSRGPGPIDAALDYGVQIGTIAVYMMDLRSQRGVDAATPIVGNAQHQRLSEWIDGLGDEVQLLVVGSSVPITFINQATVKAGMDDNRDLELDLADQWNYPGRAPNLNDNRPELVRLLDRLCAWQAGGRQVIVVGGDVHMAYGHKLRSNDGKEILSLVTSPLAAGPMDSFKQELLEGGILFKNHLVVPGYRGACLVDEVIFDPNFGELVLDTRKGRYSFSIIRSNATSELIHEGKL
jgi:phosphodiesterase/alkaline phosphatase D-like protein